MTIDEQAGTEKIKIYAKSEITHQHSLKKLGINDIRKHQIKKLGILESSSNSSVMLKNSTDID